VVADGVLGDEQRRGDVLGGQAVDHSPRHLAFGGFLLLGGRLADSYGRARLYRIGLVVFVVASVSGGLAVEPGLLIASRVVQGIGAAMLAPAGLSLLVTSYPGELPSCPRRWSPSMAATATGRR
jgi:MFS family permease